MWIFSTFLLCRDATQTLYQVKTICLFSVLFPVWWEKRFRWPKWPFPFICSAWESGAEIGEAAKCLFHPSTTVILTVSHSLSCPHQGYIHKHARTRRTNNRGGNFRTHILLILVCMVHPSWAVIALVFVFGLHGLLVLTLSALGLNSVLNLNVKTRIA